MRSTILYSVAALAAFANARALTGMSYDKRHAFGTTGQCAVQPLGSGPATTNPDTADAFLANSAYDNGANSAATPNGWTLAYQDLKAASTTGGYLGYQEISSYDTAYCAAQCCNSWPGCKSFNIYYERNPTVDPGAACPNPSSTTRIKCSFWSQSLSSADATNDGQYCSDFHVVIAGSNAYNGGCAAATTSAAATTTTSAAPTVPTPGTPIQICPVPETTYTATDGSTWAICRGTDYRGNTGQDIWGINDENACAQACSATSGCVKSVFNKQAPVCYVKNGGLTWVIDPSYSTVRQLTPATKPSGGCPSGNEFSYTAADGSKWAICKGADFQGNTYTDIHNIYSNTACADACSANSGCLKSVFSAAGSVCYLKNGGLNWVANPSYDTIRQTAPAPAPSPTTTKAAPTTTPAAPTTTKAPTTTPAAPTTTKAPTTTPAAPTTTKAATTTAPANNQPWNTWTQPKAKTCIGFICW